MGASKAATFTWDTKNSHFNQNNLKDKELQTLLDENSCRTLQELASVPGVDESFE